MPVNIKVEKKHLYLLSAIMIFLVGVGIVIALNSGNYLIHGHTADEIEGGGTGGGVSLGEWVDLTSSTQDNIAYGPVTSDGFILAYTGQNDHIGAYTGSTNPPTRHVLQQNVAVSGSGVSSVTFPVKKGDYWKIDMYWGNIGGVYWIPLVGGGGSGAHTLDNCQVCTKTYRRSGYCPSSNPLGASWTYITETCNKYGDPEPEPVFISDGTEWCTMQSVIIKCT